jgi:hypothetical protein
MPEPTWSRDWIESELRAVRNAIATEQTRVNERFATVNELRKQVLDERGVYVRHEIVSALIDRVAKLEGQAINRDDHERLANRVGRLEALGPVIALVAAGLGAGLGYFIEHIFGIHTGAP